MGGIAVREPRSISELHQRPLSVRAPDETLTFLSLSGGGYRAALYHAGVLRVLSAMRSRENRQRVFVCAVSGGAIPAYLWDIFGRMSPSWRARNALWPEKQLLALVTSSPRFGGRWHWLLRARLPFVSWHRFLQSWCRRVTNSLPPGELNKRRGYWTIFIEVLDWDFGDVYVFDQDILFLPDREAFKSASSWSACLGYSPWLVLAAAMAVPGYFPFISVRGRKTTGQPISLRLTDAGLADIYGLFPFLLALDFVTPRDAWCVSNATAGFALPKHAEASFRGPVWGFGYPRADRLSVDRQIEKLVGAVSQPLYKDAVLNLVAKATQMGVVEIKLGMEGEPLWFSTRRLPTEQAISAFPTSTNHISAKDALVLMGHGAQWAGRMLGAPDATMAALRQQLEHELQDFEARS